MASAPSVPTGLVATNVHSDGSFDLAWNPSTNAAALKTGNWTGALWGWTGSYQQQLAWEIQIGRSVGMFRAYLFATGSAASKPLSGDDLAMAGTGTSKLSDGTSTKFNGQVVLRTPYMNMIPSTNGGAVNASLWGGTAPLPAGSTSSFGGSRNNDVWTPLQIGQVDINGNVTGTRTTTVGATSGSKNITGTFTSADVGLPVTDGTKIPTGAIIVSQTGSAAVLNQNATASGSVSVTLGAGVLDPLINQWVSQYLAFPGYAFFNWNHEVDVTPQTAPSTAIWRTAYLAGGVPATISTFQASSLPIVPSNTILQSEAAARRYIIKKFRDAGATNAIFPWIVSDFRSGGPSNNYYLQSYPGSAWCDWVGWDPYDHGATSSSTGTLSAKWYNDNNWYTGLDSDPFESAWQASHTYAVNAIVVPTVSNGHFYKATAITTGISSGTQPTWPTGSGATVVDGGVTWTEQGLSSGGKPRMMGEVGTQYRSNGSRATQFKTLVSTQTSFPKVRAITYFAPNDSGTSWSGLHTTTGAVDTASVAALSSSTTGLNNALFLPDVTTGGSGVGGYTVYDSTTSIGTLSSAPVAPSKHLTGLTTGAHTISVDSFDTSGTPLHSAKSTPITVTIPTVGPSAPAAPVISVVPAAAAPQALVSWSAVTGAGGYNVYRSDDGGSTWVLKTTTPLTASTSPSYTTTTLAANPSPAYQFKVRTLDSTLQVESVDSNIVSFSSTGGNPTPSPVANLQVSLSTSGSSSTGVLFWTLPNDPLVSGVQVFYTDPNASQSGTAVPVVSLAATAAGWTDPNVITGGQTRTWYVVTVSPAGAISSTATVSSSAPTGIVSAVITASTLQLTLSASGAGATFTYDARGSSTSVAGATLTYTFQDPQDSTFIIGPTTNGVASRTFYSPGNYQTQVMVTDGTNTAISLPVSVLVTFTDGNVVTPFMSLPRLLVNDPILSFTSSTTGTVWSKLVQTVETLDAVVSTLFTMPASGDYIYNVGMTTPGSTTLGTGFNNVAHFARFLVPGGIQFNRIGLNINNAPAGGTQNATFAIYADDGSGKTPTGAPLATSATISLIGAGGWVEDTTGFSWTAPNSTGQWSYVWAMVLFAMASGTTYAQPSTAASSLIIPSPQTGGVIFPRGYSQNSISSPPNPIVPGSLSRTAAPMAIGMKVA